MTHSGFPDRLALKSLSPVIENHEAGTGTQISHHVKTGTTTYGRTQASTKAGAQVNYLVT